MHYVLLASHSADVCPTSNAKTRQVVMEVAPAIPTTAERLGVKIVAGPFVNHEHVSVAIVEADHAEDVDRFIVESRLAQWNSVRVLPSIPLQEGMKEIAEQQPIF